MPKVKQLIFEDGSIGYMTVAEGMEQSVLIQDENGKINHIVDEQEVNVLDQKQLNKLIDESKNKEAVKDKDGNFHVKDKKS